MLLLYCCCVVIALLLKLSCCSVELWGAVLQLAVGLLWGLLEVAAVVVVATVGSC